MTPAELPILPWRLRGRHRPGPVFQPVPENIDARSVLDQFDDRAAGLARQMLTVTFERELERIRAAGAGR